VLNTEFIGPSASPAAFNNWFGFVSGRTSYPNKITVALSPVQHKYAIGMHAGFTVM
jgi:hypothetical protein